jgi:hypothetical protein
LFHTDSALGIHPSEAFHPERYSTRFRPKAPTYRFAQRCSRRRSAEPARGAAVPGFCPFPESLAITWMFSPLIAGSSLGFHPSRVFQRRSWSGFRPTSSHGLFTTGFRSQQRSSRVSIDPPPGSFHLHHRSVAAKRNNPLRISAPVPSRSFEKTTTRAYEFASRLVVHHCRLPSDWDGWLTLPDVGTG